MLIGYEIGTLLELVLIVYCLFDCATTPSNRCRNLPKPVWLVLCFIPPILGPISWLLFGRPTGPQSDLPYKGNRGVPPEYDRPGRAAAQSPDDDAAFLASLRERAEEQRRAAAERARRLREQEDEAPPT